MLRMDVERFVSSIHIFLEKEQQIASFKRKYFTNAEGRMGLINTMYCYMIKINI